MCGKVCESVGLRGLWFAQLESIFEHTTRNLKQKKTKRKKSVFAYVLAPTVDLPDI